MVVLLLSHYMWVVLDSQTVAGLRFLSQCVMPPPTEDAWVNSKELVSLAWGKLALKLGYLMR